MTSQWFEETMLRNRRMHVEQCAIGIENIGAWRDIIHGPKSVAAIMVIKTQQPRDFFYWFWSMPGTVSRLDTERPRIS